MKLTEEQEKQIQKRLDETPYYGYCTEEYKEGIEDGAKWAIEKFGGIQWNKYPESEPPAKGELLVLEPDGTLHLCGWRNAYNVFEVQGKKESPEGWQWAEINLPNQ